MGRWSSAVCRRVGCAHDQGHRGRFSRRRFLLLLRKSARHPPAATRSGAWLHNGGRFASPSRGPKNARSRRPGRTSSRRWPAPAGREDEIACGRDVRPVLDEEINGAAGSLSTPLLCCATWKARPIRRAAGRPSACPVGTILCRGLCNGARGRLRATAWSGAAVTRRRCPLLALLLRTTTRPRPLFPAPLIESCFIGAVLSSSSTGARPPPGTRSITIHVPNQAQMDDGYCWPSACFLSLVRLGNSRSRRRAAPVPQTPDKKDPPARLPPSVDQPAPPARLGVGSHSGQGADCPGWPGSWR